MEVLMRKFWFFLLLATLIGSAANIVIAGVGNNRSEQVAQSSQTSPAAPDKKDDKKVEDCGCDSKTPPDVLATVNGVKINLKEIEDPIAQQLSELRKQVTEARKREPAVQINTRLLAAEARRRGLTNNQFLEQEIGTKIKDPSEAEALAFYNQNRAQIQGEFDKVKPDIINYLRSQREQDEAAKLATRLRATAKVNVLIDPLDASPDRSRVVATVNSENITQGDVEDRLKPLVASIDDQIYELRKRQLDARINDMLLEQEAQKRKVPARQLYDSEVLNKIKPVTDEEAKKFYDDNKARIQGTFEERRAQIIQYVQTQRESEAEAALAGELRKAGSVKVYLSPPEPPVFTISTNGRPWRGGASATVTIIEFTDFQCPSCARTQPILEDLVKEYGDKLKLVVRDFPLDQHKQAFKAAEAAEAAQAQGKFWEFTALLFKNQEALQVDKLKEYASQIGLDRAKFDKALDSGQYAATVQSDLEDGEKVGVDSTPTVFINGKRIKEKTAESLKAAVEAALRR
jgi:protein-disulfide isomerase